MRRRKAPLSSVEYFDLVRMYCGTEPILPPEICMIILEMANMCNRSKRCTFFWVYF